MFVDAQWAGAAWLLPTGDLSESERGGRPALEGE
jgi:hypothetical protein